MRGWFFDIKALMASAPNHQEHTRSNSNSQTSTTGGSFHLGAPSSCSCVPNRTRSQPQSSTNSCKNCECSADTYFRNLTKSGASNANSNNLRRDFISRLVEAARGLLAGLAPLYRSIDQCVLYVGVQNEKSGQVLGSELREARARTTDLIRALEKADADVLRSAGGGNDGRGADVSLEASYEKEGGVATVSKGIHRRSESVSSMSVRDSLADACANATASYRQILKNIAPYLPHLGSSLDSRQLRTLLLNTHSAATEFGASWDSLTSLLSEKSPPFEYHQQVHPQRVTQQSPQQHISTLNLPSSNSSSSAASAGGSFTSGEKTSTAHLPPPSIYSSQLPNARICSTAGVATAVSEGALCLLDDISGSSLPAERPNIVDDFVKHIPIAKQATERLARALECFGPSNPSGPSSSTPFSATTFNAGAEDKSQAADRFLAGRKLLEEAEVFVNSIIRFLSLARQMTMATHHSNQDRKEQQEAGKTYHSISTFSRTTLSGIAMVTRATKDLATALHDFSASNTPNVVLSALSTSPLSIVPSPSLGQPDQTGNKVSNGNVNSVAVSGYPRSAEYG